MGKIKGIFATNITGKVGNVVFRKNGKQNVVAQRPSSVKNPRSDMQQRQRAYIKTVASAYSVFKPICDHSFEGVTYGGQSMNFFNKENYRIVASDVKAVLKNSSNVVVPCHFLMAKGSIRWNNNFGEGGQIANIGKYLTDNKITDISTLKYYQLLEALGIKRGDQLTIINVSQTSQAFFAGGNSIEQRACEMYYTRYIFDASEVADNSTKALTAVEGGFKLSSSILGEESELDWRAVLNISSTGVVKVVDVNGEAPYMCTAIISRKNAGKWLRSTATMNVKDTFIGNVGIEEVLPSYSPSGERYLNNAML